MDPLTFALFLLGASVAIGPVSYLAAHAREARRPQSERTQDLERLERSCRDHTGEIQRVRTG